MAQLQNFGASSCLILGTLMTILFLTGCSAPEKEIVTVTKIQKTTVPIVARPKPLQLVDTKVYVVNAENIDEFIAEFTEIHGDLAFVALSINDYENLAINIADIRRFINQQNEIIVYYEKAVTDDEEKSVPPNETTNNGDGQ